MFKTGIIFLSFIYCIDDIFFVNLQWFDLQLVIAAVDNGNPYHESLKLLSVVLSDEDDNTPHFQQIHHQFTVRENLAPGIIVGKALFIASCSSCIESSASSGLTFYKDHIPGITYLGTKRWWWAKSTKRLTSWIWLYLLVDHRQQTKPSNILTKYNYYDWHGKRLRF